MFKNLLISLLLITLIPTMVSAVHYYNVEHEVPLYIDSTRVVLKFENSLSPMEQSSMIASIQRLDQVLVDEC